MPDDRTAGERSLHASIAAHASWAQTASRRARTAPARRAMDERFERLVDPDGVMTPADRAAAVENARQAHYRRMALRSAQARRARKATGTAPAAEAA